MTNPLLNLPLHPDYPSIKAEHIEEAVTTRLDHAKDQLKALALKDVSLGWEAVISPLDESLDALSRCWAVVGHLNAVMDEAAWRQAFNKMLPLVTDFYTMLEQDQTLLAACQKLQQQLPKGNLADLNLQRSRSLELAIQDFRLAGAELPKEKRQQLAQIIKQLSEKGQQFSEHVLDAMNGSSCHVEESSGLEGLPEDVIEAAKKSAQEAGQEGWRFTPHMPSYLPVMQYAHDRKLREQMYRMYNTLASDQGESQFDNGPLIKEILTLRKQSANLLGFSDFVAMSLKPKMASSTVAVQTFLIDLLNRVKPQAQKEFAALSEFAARQLGIDKLEAWDIPYVSQQLKQRLYSFSDQDVKAYFQLNRVLEGLFQLIQDLFDYRFEKVNLPVWHPDVLCYAIYATPKVNAAPSKSNRAEDEVKVPQVDISRAEGEDDVPLAEGNGPKAGETARAYVYLDLYARPGKRSGAWMNVAANRRLSAKGITEPIAWLTCNFQAPVGSRPAMLTHDEVTTLFHEFGHGLHHVLTNMQEPRISGLNGVEWDAVELPSQFLENFAWEWEQIQKMTAHFETGSPMPEDLYQRMLQARHFMMGMYLLRQLEFGLFDIELHKIGELRDSSEVMALLNEIRRQVAVVPYPEWNRFPHAFSHIFAGGYAAGYYSYLWAEVLSADCYMAFTREIDGEIQALEQSERSSLGKRFLNEILALGSVRPAIDHFKAFMQREPRQEALLKLYGMRDSAQLGVGDPVQIGVGDKVQIGVGDTVQIGVGGLAQSGVSVFTQVGVNHAA